MAPVSTNRVGERHEKMAVGILMLALAGCSTASDRDNIVATSTIFGAVAGALLGYELLGSGTGRFFTAALFGAGGAAGAYFAAQKFLPAEMAQINDAGYESLATLPIGATSEWANAETGNSGSFTPTREKPFSKRAAMPRNTGGYQGRGRGARNAAEGLPNRRGNLGHNLTGVGLAKAID